jgi:AcrR family transcriptional regulator
MAYEVIKRRGGRAYRYAVEYYRDDNGKGRTRWTYQGPVEEAPPRKGRAAAAEERRASTRIALLDALERLLERFDYAKVTADAIAREAGVAHGTFYRYYTDKADALRASMSRVAERIEQVAEFDAPLTTPDAEYARVANWIDAYVHGVHEHTGIWRAWIALSATDPHVAARRREYRAAAIERIAAYLQRLHAAGFASIEMPVTFARTMVATMDGVTRAAGIDGTELDATTLKGVRDYVNRAIFGVPVAAR